MAARIKPDVLQALEDWNAGKPVKSLELGHCHRMKENPGASPSIDMSKHIHRDQERAHAYCFHLIELFNLNGVPGDHGAFLAACDDYEMSFTTANTDKEIATSQDFSGVTHASLTDEERDAAESLVWKALLVGWNRAIAGHDPEMYIEVTNPAAVSA